MLKNLLITLALLGGAAFGQNQPDWNNIKNRPSGPPNQVVATNPSGSTNATAYVRSLVQADLPAGTLVVPGATVTGSGSTQVVTFPNAFAVSGAMVFDANGQLLTDESTPSNPASGTTRAYSKSGKLCSLSPAGVENCTGTGGVYSFNSRIGAVVPIQNDYTGLTVTWWGLGPDSSASYTSVQPIFVASGSTATAMKVPMAITIPTNGATTSPTATSTCYLGTLPTASWTATLYHIASSTAGCTGASTSMGTVAISTAGVQTWSLTQTSFAAGDCLEVTAPSSVDATAAYLQCSLVVVK